MTVLFGATGKRNQRDWPGIEIKSAVEPSSISPATPTGISYTLQSESTYDWEISDWSIPVLIGVGKVTAIGKQRVQIFAGARYYLSSLPNGPEGFGLRLNFVLLFPK